MRLVLSFALCAMLLAGCNSVVTTGMTPHLSDAAQLQAEKVYGEANVAYHTAGSAYEAARPWLSPDVKARCMALSAQALDLLHAAKAALTIGDTATLQAKLDAIGSIRDQITALTTPVAAAHGVQ